MWPDDPAYDTDQIPQAAAEHPSKKASKRTWAAVEPTNGILKFYFLCLAQPGGKFLYFIWTAFRIIIGCCLLCME